MFYETKTKKPTKVYRVLSCVLYFYIENYVCIDFFCCHYKTLSVMPSDKIFAEGSNNKSLVVDNP